MSDYHIAIVAITTLSGLFLTIQRLIYYYRLNKEKETLKIIQIAKEEVEVVKVNLENEISNLKANLKYLELNINKDLNHLKETYEVDMKSLSEKIQNLREELREQHLGILSILNKLIDKN